MKKKLNVIMLIATAVTILTGCNGLKKEMQEASANKQSIVVTAKTEADDKNHNTVTWKEVDQLTSYEDIRKEWDSVLKIIPFDFGSKNGVLYVGLDGKWQGNNTLYNAFQNKKFVLDYWNNGSTQGHLADLAVSRFKDLNNQLVGIIGSINAYYNILPSNSDKTSGLNNVLSRAAAMAAIVRGDTPVQFVTENKDFTSTVGPNEYNECAQLLADTDQCFLKYQNGGLNFENYNNTMTTGEMYYILANRYFPDEMDSSKIVKNLDAVKNAGDVAKKIGLTKDSYAVEAFELEWCMQHSEDGCPEEIYKAMSILRNHKIIDSSAKWDASVTGGYLLTVMLKCYQYGKDENTGWKVNAERGSNIGDNFVIRDNKSEEKNVKVTNIGVDRTEAAQIYDVTNLDDLFRVYGSEIDMTEEETEEAYAIASKFEFSNIDMWRQIDFCDNLNVRKGPTTAYDIVATIPKGTKVHIVAMCDNNGWYRIIANNKIVYQCGVYFSDFDGSEEMLKKSGENANVKFGDNVQTGTNISGSNWDESKAKKKENEQNRKNEDTEKNE